MAENESSTYVLCPNEFYREVVITALYEYDPPEHDMTLVIDEPWGLATKTKFNDHERWIIITNNPCPEYWEDLWDIAPTALIAGNKSFSEVMQIIYRAAKGERSKVTPFYKQKLTPKERKILSLCAQGYFDKEIAEQLKQNQQTISNCLKVIYDKLDLSEPNRTSAALYYWGVQGDYSK
jgi:DNA-binding NarL/FixJ family response regulator